MQIDRYGLARCTALRTVDYRNPHEGAVGKKLERRLAAVLSADMVAFSRLMELDEQGAAARQKGHRAELVDAFRAKLFRSVDDRRGGHLRAASSCVPGAGEDPLHVPQRIHASPAPAPDGLGLYSVPILAPPPQNAGRERFRCFWYASNGQSFELPVAGNFFCAART